jgi:hypothetical protein
MGGKKRYKDLGYKRGGPNERKVLFLMRQLENLGVNISYQDHELIVFSRQLTVDESGIVLT